MMATLWEPKVDIGDVTGPSLPDTFEASNDALYPKDDLVISRTVDGQPLSRYGDQVWDLTPYRRAHESAIFKFGNWFAKDSALGRRITQQAKELFFCIMYKSNVLYSVGSLGQSWVALRTIATVAYRIGIPLDQITQGQNYFPSLLNHLELTGTRGSVKNTGTLFVRLLRVGSDNIGFNIFSSEYIAALDKLAATFPEPNQTAVIPQRLYLNLIMGLEAMLKEFLGVADKLEFLLQRASICSLYGRSISWQQRILADQGLHLDKKHHWRGYLSSDFKEVVADLGLTEWCSKFNVAKIHLVASALHTIQHAAKILIHVFTGMRSTEAQFLPFNALKTKRLGGKSVQLVDGYTHKLSKGVKAASWVTATEAGLPFTVAQRVAEIIAGVGQVCLSGNQDSPLFLSISMLPRTLRSGGKEMKEHKRYEGLAVADFTTSVIRRCIKLLGGSLAIVEDDIVELENIDPHRDWRNDDLFSVGAEWPLASHQLRRSLAVYASNSGLVTLPSLKRQLQHITEEMTLYYGSNSTFAKNFVSESKKNRHISDEYAEESLTSSALLYMRDVVLSDARLFGVHGSQVQKSKNNRNNYIAISTDRGETITRFKNGELAYRETLLGGCVSADPCSQGSFMAITSCLGCHCAFFSESIDTPNKIKKAAKAVAYEIQHSVKESFEYLAAKKQWDDLRRLLRELTGGEELVLEEFL